jgi:rare lipoprotein A
MLLRADWLIIGALALLGLLAGCSTSPIGDGAPERPQDISEVPDAVPHPEPLSRYGNPPYYEVFGKRYYTLKSSKGYAERGIASWYGTKFHGKRTSSGEPYDMYSMTAAHKTLPLPTFAKVTNLKTGRSIVVRINDRGPFHDNRVVDLSYAAAAKLGILDQGTGLVELRALDPSQGEPVAQPSPPPRAYPNGPNLYVQVGAFGSHHNADRLRSSLQGTLERAIRIQNLEVAGKPLYRVQVGPLASVENADALSERLTQLGFQDVQVVVE